jgi:hypothetical protein
LEKRKQTRSAREQKTRKTINGRRKDREGRGGRRKRTRRGKPTGGKVRNRKVQREYSRKARRRG